MFFGCSGVGLSYFQPLVESFGSVAADGCESFFASFPEDSHDAGAAVPVGEIESDQFGDSQPGRVHGFEYGAVTNSCGSVCGGCGEQAADLFCGEEVWEFASTAGVTQGFGGVGFADSFAIAEAEEAAEAGQSSGDGGACVATFVEPGDVAAEDAGIELCGVRNFSCVFLQEFADVIEIISVGLDGQFGGVSFDFEETEESLNGRIHVFCFADRGGSVELAVTDYRLWRVREPGESCVRSGAAGVIPGTGGELVRQNRPKFECVGRENGVCDCAESGLRA